MPKPRAYVNVIGLNIPQEEEFGVSTTDMKGQLDDWVACTEAEFAQTEPELIDTSDELNGYSGPTRYDVEMINGSIGRKFLMSAEVLLYLWGLQLGNVTTSAASTASNEQWTITVTGGETDGAFVLKWRGYTTDPIDTAGMDATSLGAGWETHPLVEPTDDFTIAGTGPFTITAKAGGAYENQQLEPPVVEIVTALNAVGTVVLSTTTEGGAANVYTHTLKWPSECVLNPPSTEMLEALKCGGSTGTYKLLTGVVVDQTDLEISRKGWIDLTANLRFREEVPYPTASLPASISAVTRVKGVKLKVFLGDAFTDEVPNNLLRNLKISISSGIVVPPTIGGDQFVPEFQYGEKQPSITIELNIRGDKADAYYAMYTNSLNGTRYKFKIELEPHATPQRKITLQCEQVFVKATADKDGNETRLQLMIMPEWNDTDDGPATIAIQSSIAQILQTY